MIKHLMIVSKNLSRIKVWLGGKCELLCLNNVSLDAVKKAPKNTSVKIHYAILDS